MGRQHPRVQLARPDAAPEGTSHESPAFLALTLLALLPRHVLLSHWGWAWRIWTATLFLFPACFLFWKKNLSSGSVWRGPEGSKLSKHDPWYFIFQLFREVRIMKVLNHPNIGENQSSFLSSSPTARLHFPACGPSP